MRQIQDIIQRSFASALAGQVGGGLLGQAGQLFMGNSLNNMQVDQQQALDQVQEQNQPILDQIQNQYAEQLWNYEGTHEVANLEAQGLNPQLAMGYSGNAGGISQPVQVGTSTPQQNYSPFNLDIGSAMQTAADVDLKHAQADKIRSDTPTEGNTGDVAVGKGKAEIQDILQGVVNKQAQEALTNAQTIAQNIGNKIQGLSADDQISTINSEMIKAQGEARSAQSQGEIDENTMNLKQSIINSTAINSFLQTLQTKAQTANIKADTTLKGAQTTNVNQQTTASKNEQLNANVTIMQNARKIEQQWDSLTIQQKQQRAQELYQSGLIDLGQQEIFIQGMNAIMGAAKTGSTLPSNTPRNPIGFNR